MVWKRANATAALSTLITGGISSLTIGVCYLAKWPNETIYPHFMLLSFYIFASLIAFMVVISLLTKPQPNPLPSLLENIHQKGNSSRLVWFWWVVLFLMMMGLYLFFNNGRVFSMF